MEKGIPMSLVIIIGITVFGALFFVIAMAFLAVLST
jgi:hypothetical protein